ncbi:Fur family transcriptional regulator, zinc uptake regulator [Pseudorhodobacter antarcticus]|uniref:Fur family transcriptional regulator, zinc uptake regulator n=1 Tax=Pseudorhodobacter antarcticus TaxID=1077947 RepID=A0A1H8CHW6_9RHOB|nr:Fur family transcriptional regulator [Pseudorhodobacter antarcticus]SEM94645.1 Fur family transcriptional regulator, zinc uptake regulator [Pseudorhodobacter antarcticus]
MPNAFDNHDHSHCATTGLAQAETILAARNQRLTPVRRETLRILLSEHRALGAYDVLERLADAGFGKQPPVAYRALEFLVDQGFAHKITRLNAFAACMHPDTDHAPVFLICRICHALAETAATPVRTALNATAHAVGFTVERSSIEAVGRCPNCKDAA